MVQSYNTSAHILRYQACDPELEEDGLKPISMDRTSEGEARVVLWL